MLASRWSLLFVAAALIGHLLGNASSAGADERCDCYSPTFNEDTAALLIWQLASGGSLSDPLSYFPICNLPNEGPDPAAGDPLRIAPTAIDAIQISNRFSPAFSTPGDLGGPIIGTITTGSATYHSLGILAGDNETFGRSDIVLDAKGILTLKEALQASGVRAPDGVTNLAITGFTVRSEGFVAIRDVDIRGAIAVSSELPTEGYTLSSHDVRISGHVRSGDVLIGQGPGSTGRLDLANGATLEQTEGFGLMFAGVEGIGVLTVGASGRVVSDGLFAGTGDNGTGVVEVGADGKLLVNRSQFARVEIGRRSHAELSIAARGEVQISSALQIGSEAGGDGSVFVGPGALLHSSSPFGNLQMGGLDLGSGGPGKGRLDIEGGAVRLGGRALIGAAEAGVGDVTVIGGELSVRERLVVGHGGKGTLRVARGGALHIESALDGEGLRIGRYASGSGLVEFADADSSVTGLGTRATIGLLGDGTLVLNRGFQLAMPAGTIVLGQEAGAVGRITVEGTGTRLSSSELRIGDKGVGRVTVVGGGLLQTESNATLGEGDGPAGRISSVEVDGSDSRWEIGSLLQSTDFIMGNRSGARVIVKNGGRVDVKSGGRLLVGSKASGDIDIQSGGQLLAKGDLVLGEFATGEGSVRVDGSEAKLTAGHAATIGAQGSGSLYLANGGTLELASGLLTSRTMVLGQETGSHGLLDIRGLGSALQLEAMKVGAAGEGQLVIGAGGFLGVHGDLEIGGTTATGRGRTEVLGAGARMDARRIALGTRRTDFFGANEPSLLIRDHATVKSEVADIGVESPASFRLDQGALWEAGRVRMGVNISSVANEGLITTGATLKAERLDLTAIGHNSLTLQAGKLEVYNGHLKIGADGTDRARLAVELGSEVRTTDDFQIHLGSDEVDEAELKIGVGSSVSTADLLASGRSLVTVDGGVLDVEGLLLPGSNSIISIDNGGQVKTDILQPAGASSFRIEVDNGSELAVNQLLNIPFLHVKNAGRVVDRRTNIMPANQLDVFTLLAESGGIIDFRGGTAFLPAGGAWRVTEGSQMKVARLTTFGGSQLEVSDGARLEADVAQLTKGHHMLVAGEGASFEAGTVVIREPNGLKISNGATARFGTLSLQDGGSVTMSGGALQVAKFLQVEGQTFGSARPLNVRGGGVVIGEATPVANSLVVGAGGELRGSPNVVGDVVMSGGRMAPGFSPGKAVIDGDLVVKAGSSFDMEIGGLGEGMLDFIDVAGALMIEPGATLNLIFIDGFAPSAGDVMKLFRVGGDISGQFSEIKVHNLAAGWTYEFAPAAGSMELTSLSNGTFTGVPEPTAALPAAVGAIGLAISTRRRQMRKPSDAHPRPAKDQARQQRVAFDPYAPSRPRGLRWLL